MTNDQKHIFIIAEAGVNHNGELRLAMKLVEAAAEAGADAVKFQTFKAETIVAATAPKAEYQKESTNAEESQYAMLKKLELSKDDFLVIQAHCAKYKIAFMSTPFDLASIDLLVEMGLETFKIPSGEITNLPYLRKIGSLQKELILSTGMADMKEIDEALTALTAAGTPREKITILHCTTQYPTPMANVNLRAMVTIAQAFNVRVGYSDHTLGIEVPIAAVALGAVVIEKHFTLDKNLEGPDHKASLEAGELNAMVRAIRNIEKALGSPEKRPTTSELLNRPVARKSIIATQPIAKGEKFSEANLTVKRPGTGISPMNWDNIIGISAAKDFDKDEIITL
ncbi:MAG: N-acetylneuraminate synthase [Desulfobulbaceae bacterium]|nr:N-acetylneuraminate synthase [Desulfobulbaceae bacterium]